MRLSWYVCAYIVVVSGFALATPLQSSAFSRSNPARVLVINSYHPGYPLSDEEMAGLHDSVSSSADTPEIFIEYLDTKRFALKPRISAVKAALRSKYGAYVPDIVVALDNDAFDFIVKIRDELFPGVPVVFAGINNFDYSMMRNIHNITGVIENPDYRGTIAVAHRFMPNIREIIVVYDDTMTGRAHVNAVRKVEPEFSGVVGFRYLSLGEMSFASMRDTIKAAGKGSAVLLLSHFIDHDGVTMSQDESIRYIFSAAKVPFFVITDSRIGSGAVGGNVVSGYYQGKRSGEMVMAILRGVPPGSIPVDVSGSNRYMFDYRALSRYAVDFNLLPPDSIIKNEPDLSYKRKYQFVLITVAIIVPLIMIIIILIINVLMRRRAEKALKVIRNRYLLITQNMSDTVWMLDLDLKKMYLSPSIARNCGYSFGELWAMSSRNYVSPTSFAAAREHLTAYLNSARLNDPSSQLAEKIEMEFVRKDGSMFLTETQINVMRDENGKPIGFLGVGRDITERRAIENSLMESERRMREMLENIQLITVMIDSGGRIIFCNDYFLKVCGWRREEVLNKCWFDIFTPSNTDENDDMFSRLLETGAPLHYENELVTREGISRTISWNNTIMRDATGSRIGITSVGIDITEKKIAEQELKESELKFRMLIEQSIEGIVLVDERGKIVEWNSAVEEITGLKSERTLGECASDIFFGSLPVEKQTSERHVSINHMIDSVLRGGDAPFLNMPVEMNILSERGDFRNICITVFPIVTGTGFRIGAIISDITARKSAENAIRASLDEKEILLKEIHHRVKNNLQIISSLLHLQESYIKDSEDAEIFRDSRNRIKTMAMIHEKLYQSKEFSRLDFTSYVRSLGAGLFTAYGATIDRIALSIEIDDVSLDIDSSISCGLLINELLSNALKYAFPGDRCGTIGVMLRCVDGEFILNIHDDGVGFPENFSVGDAGTLGLRLVRAMVDQLHGTIDVRKGKTGGVEYEIRFRVTVNEHDHLS